MQTVHPKVGLHRFAVSERSKEIMESFQTPTLNMALLTPVFLVASWALVLMFIDLYVAERNKHVTGWLSLVGIVPALLYTITQWGDVGGAFYGTNGLPMVMSDNFSTFLNVLYLITAILTVMISVGYVKQAGIARGEFYFLMLFSLCGMMLMGMSNDLILIFLALELLSIPLYILSGFDQTRLESEEAALKYFLLGAFSSGFLVFGIALTYGAAGSTSLPIIAQEIGSSGMLGMAGIAMMLVGFAFKVGAVPFHMWTPDVYEGAPTAVTAFMSVGAKVGGFAAMLRIFVGALSSVGDAWVPAIAVIAALTMIVGNIAAVSQQNIKRMLAYSSIAHAGYILMAVAASLKSEAGVSSALFYMMTYLFTNIGAFAVVMALERHEGKQGLLLEDYKGLSKRNLGMAIVMAYFMLSLTGIPLTGGFMGKFYVFFSTIEANLVWLAVVGVLTSVVSAFYYLRVIFFSFMYDGTSDNQPIPTALSAAIGVTAVVTVILGFIPGPWYDIARDATMGTIQMLAGG